MLSTAMLGVEDEFAALVKRYEDALNRRELETVASMYTENAWFIHHYMPAARGPAGVQAAYEALWNHGFREMRIIEILDVQQNGTDLLAIDRWAATGENGQPLGTGYSTVLCRREDQRWKIVLHVTTPDRPPTARA